jgi:glycosyltransferase involved in cell wall biosynthesis
MKVVWLCNFANQEMNEHFKTSQLNEFAPWINNLIELFRIRTEVDLHIVAPNVFNNTDCSFNKDTINYHFYKRIPIPYNNKYVRKIHTFLQIEHITNFFWIKRKIANCIRKINPDIIHLHGAENPYYSAGILPLFDKFPVLTTVQGFIRNTADINSVIRKAIEIEEIILKKSKHIGVRTDEMSKIAHRINPDASLHFHYYPITVPSVIKNNIGNDEPIDCLFFASVRKDKGIEDLLVAIHIVKKMYPDITLTVIGGTRNRYLSYLKKLCSELNIEDNVQFLGFLPTQEDIYRYALQAKICVLPTYHDIIPGTIIESMLLKLPVISYAVGGIPELNRKGKTLILVEKQNINQLAEMIILLLNNADLRKTLAEKAYTLAHERVDKSNVVPDIINAYKSILKENNFLK